MNTLLERRERSNEITKQYKTFIHYSIIISLSYQSPTIHHITSHQHAHAYPPTTKISPRKYIDPNSMCVRTSRASGRIGCAFPSKYGYYVCSVNPIPGIGRTSMGFYYCIG